MQEVVHQPGLMKNALRAWRDGIDIHLMRGQSPDTAQTQAAGPRPVYLHRPANGMADQAVAHHAATT